MSRQLKATIVGAGLGGVMMAIRLARQGYQVDLYERRANVDKVHVSQRSFTITLSRRGLAALDEIGLMQEALAVTVPLRGRMVHDRTGSQLYVPYGNKDSEQIYSIRRHDMNALLYRKAIQFETIHFHFNHRLVQLNKEQNQLWFEDEDAPGQPTAPIQAEMVIGGDGVFSMVRQQMQRGERADFHQDFLDWGYKDVFIPPLATGQHAFARNALHLWPRGNCTFFAFPNLDGSYSGNFIGPFDIMEKLNTNEAAETLMRSEFGDLLEAAPSMPQQLLSAPLSHFVTVYTSQWHYKDRIVLLGDAAHAVTPFWGEGMNASFEDTSTLESALLRHGEDRAKAFAYYQSQRKINTDTLAELAKQNFVELRDTTASAHVVARKVLERKLYQLFPEKWLPLNIMISHRLLTYVEAVERYKKQQKIARLCGADILVWLLACWLSTQQLFSRLLRSLINIRSFGLENSTNGLHFPHQTGSTDSGAANGR